MSTDMLSYAVVAAGFAAIGGFWGQLKGIFSYISSAIILQSKFDYQLTGQTLLYLRANAKVLPSGKSLFHIFHLKLKTKGTYGYVPFKLPSETCVYIHRNYGVFMIYDQSVYGLRGISNFKGLIGAVLVFYEDLQKNTRKSSNFCINPIKGSAGSFILKNNAPSPEIVTASKDTLSGFGNSVNYHIDRSWLYDCSEYAVGTEDDTFQGLFYNPATLKLVDIADNWLTKEQWYISRGIPWRLGYLLYGLPGTGKSSFVKALAQKLGIPISHFYLSTLTDNEFVDHWHKLPTPGIVLFEDFDTVFHLRENITKHKSLSFDTVLNMVSGVSALSGVLLIVTTNSVDAIDDALGKPIEGTFRSTRPGRIDYTLEFGLTTKKQREEIASHVLKDYPHLIEGLVGQYDNVTPAQFQAICIDTVYTVLHS